MTLPSWIPTVAGLGLLGLVLADVFGTLWHPTGAGRVSRTLGSWSWRAARRLGPRALDLAGPALLVGVVVTWAGLAVLGAALVYWPALAEDGFSYNEGLRPDHRSTFADALYVSGVVLSTLGLGDVVPRGGWMRAMVAGEGLIGFSLLTAAVSWVVQLQGALVRRRTLARFLDVLRRADPTGRRPVPDAVLTEVLHGVAAARVDLRQLSPTYFFRDGDARASLALALPYAVSLAQAAQAAEQASTRSLGAALSLALDDLAELLAERFLHTGGDVERVLRLYALDHGHDPDGWAADRGGTGS